MSDYRERFTRTYPGPLHQKHSDTIRDAATFLADFLVATVPPTTDDTPATADPATAAVFLALRGLDVFVRSANDAILTLPPTPEEPAP